MASLPSGTVTMLFSDIESSTRLLARLGDDYAEALTRQRQLLRHAWRDAGGRELGTEGDSFFVVFEAAHDAVGAALAGQRALEDADWPGGERVRVRMGMHTGEPTRHEDGYVGMDVHRAARVAAVAHGGQVVMTEPTSSLVRDKLPAGALMNDLGAHRLKDMPAAEHLFQVAGAGLQVDFPPLRSLGAVTSLPRPRTPLLGRERELAALVDRLSDPNVRLVTLTGPGGTGKTRLAIAVATEVAGSASDGVYFIPLAGATTLDAMWATIAEQLRFKDSTPARVLSQIAPRHMLLVLDNLEQLRDAAQAVEELLTHAPEVRILATSRRPLHVTGEHDYTVQALELPTETTMEAAIRAPAVQLFCHHAAMVRADFELTEANAGDVAAICDRLDGLPLAIELTAARSKLLSPAALVARIDTALDATTADAARPPRQRSLRETLAWSHNLLEPELQSFFRRLGVFPGSAGLDAVDVVTGAAAPVLDLVAVLVDLSLVRLVEGPDGEPRVTLLQTVRDFARDELTAFGELDATHARHAEYFAAFAERVAPDLTTLRALDAADQLSLEHDNVRRALTWSLLPEEPGGVPAGRRVIGCRICVALWWFWASQGHVVEGVRWFERAHALCSGEDGPRMARLLLGLGIWDMWGSTSNPSTRPEHLEDALRMAERWSDLRTMAEAASTLAQWHERREHIVEAAHLYERSLAWAEENGDDSSRASTLHHYAWLVFERGDTARARAMLEESLEISARAGHERDVVGRRSDVADLQFEAGDPSGAWAALVALVPDVVRLREPALCVSVLGSFADIALRTGDLRRGVVLGSARDRYHVEIGWPESVLDEWETMIAEHGQVLGEDEYAGARAEGQALTLFGALEYAVLSEPPSGPVARHPSSSDAVNPGEPSA